MTKYIITLLLLTWYSLTFGQFPFELKTGDLLFQDLDCGPLCDAIESVTEGVNGRDFSHCGIVLIEDNKPIVIEAIGPGVIKTPLNKFLKRSGDSIIITNVAAARLKVEYQTLIQPALDSAMTLLGKGYDQVFDLNNDTYYCSELLYVIFKKANKGNEVFSLNPMTFKMPGSHSFDPAWIDYYKDLGVPIPENEMGTNPGLISRSDKIFILK